MGLQSSKFKNNINICLTIPFNLEFVQKSETHLSGFRYRYYKPKSEKKINLDGYEQNLRIYVNITNTDNKFNTIEEIYNMPSSLYHFKNISTKDGRQLENKAYHNESSLTLRLDPDKFIIKELVYVSKHKFDQT